MGCRRDLDEADRQERAPSRDATTKALHRLSINLLGMGARATVTLLVPVSSERHCSLEPGRGLYVDSLVRIDAGSPAATGCKQVNVVGRDLAPIPGLHDRGAEGQAVFSESGVPAPCRGTPVFRIAQARDSGEMTRKDSVAASDRGAKISARAWPSWTPPNDLLIAVRHFCKRPLLHRTTGSNGSEAAFGD